MKNQLVNHLATKQIFACDNNQILQAVNASIDDLEMEDFFQLRPESKIENGIGMIWIQGLLTNDVPKIYEKAGIVTTYDTIKSEIEGLILAGAQAIQININSGGGSVNGAIELSRWIASIPVATAAFVTSCACSAAYMIAASADRITASETAMVGNIGTIISWTDYTAFDERMGIAEKALTNEGATLKSTFHMEPNEEQLAFLQETINQHGKAFADFVLSKRGVDMEVFKAGWYSGQKALDLRLVDNLTEI
jgi:ClpP class serine protease